MAPVAGFQMVLVASGPCRLWFSWFRRVVGRLALVAKVFQGFQVLVVREWFEDGCVHCDGVFFGQAMFK